MSEPLSTIVILIAVLGIAVLVAKSDMPTDSAIIVAVCGIIVVYLIIHAPGVVAWFVMAGLIIAGFGILRR